MIELFLDLPILRISVTASDLFTILVFANVLTLSGQWLNLICKRRPIVADYSDITVFNDHMDDHRRKFKIAVSLFLLALLYVLVSIYDFGPIDDPRRAIVDILYDIFTIGTGLLMSEYMEKAMQYT